MTGWSVETLKELLEARLNEAEKRNEQRFAAQEKAVAAALQAAKEAVAKAENAAEKRFDSVNEFRAQLSDQTNTLMPRLEAEQRINQLGEKINSLASRADARDGKTGGAAGLWSMLVAGGGVIIAIGMLIVVANR